MKANEQIETTKKIDKNIYYLSPYQDKGWKIMKKGGVRPTRVFLLKKDAIDYVKTLGRNQDAVVYIQKKDGSFQEVRNYRDMK
ncbi:DUF2188 domain-containing protein [Ureaplasma miroungigenitalium]|uniref:DUF2188 domain-containing protein n=1 Tax=Ureaplasma miroungigenitalium TaxID=1042321 RepID=A0ABT3BNF5_9BACT|nr:DUF2188 domain-containing protein [Ureaplasma miroungigenitalium]MCV3728547.1 DUF2188 domain-containing protein [Ureaplasma miroungigenitalium]MCV3734446.1 DUF2188 domain-containing protein [Ureaplasma miroungigenitalium]